VHFGDFVNPNIFQLSLISPAPRNTLFYLLTGKHDLGISSLFLCSRLKHLFSLPLLHGHRRRFFSTVITSHTSHTISSSRTLSRFILFSSSVLSLFVPPFFFFLPQLFFFLPLLYGFYVLFSSSVFLFYGFSCFMFFFICSSVF